MKIITTNFPFTFKEFIFHFHSTNENVISVLAPSLSLLYKPRCKLKINEKNIYGKRCLVLFERQRGRRRTEREYREGRGRGMREKIIRKLI
jgi:hypothetical protein